MGDSWATYRVVLSALGAFVCGALMRCYLPIKVRGCECQIVSV